MIPNRYLFIDHSTKVGEQSHKYQLLSLTTMGVKEKNINVSGGKVPETYDNYQTVEPGDMIFCLFDLDCSAVFSGLSNCSGMITSAYDVLKPNPIYLDNLYADFWFQYVFSNRYYKIYSKNIRYTITTDMFKSIMTLIPPIETQRKIGKFLFEKHKKIEDLIANQQAQIEKLKEYKQSVITEAVTKGLDSSAPMKDSGVDWIGEIPENWEILRIKNIGWTQNGISKGGDYFGQGYPFVSYGDVYKNIVLPESVDGLIETTEQERNNYSVQENDIFFTRTSETIEEVGFSCVCKKTITNATFAGFLISFLVEDVTVFGTHYKRNGNIGEPVILLSTKQFLEIFKNSKVDYVFFGSLNDRYLVICDRSILNDDPSKYVDLFNEEFYIIPAAPLFTAAKKI